MIVVPSRMGRLNKRALLGHLRCMGSASRAELAKSLGLSQPTAGKIVDDLLEMGVLEEFAADGGPSSEPGSQMKLGRPGRMLRLNRSKPRFLGLELGVRETRLALLSPGTTDSDQWAARIRTPETAKGWIGQLRKVAENFSEKKFWGVLVSVPGLVDERRGRVIFSPNLHWTERAALPALLQQVWSAPAVLVQEERALALGHHAADPAGEDFLLADFGDGVGGAVVIGGKLYTHPLPLSGELGHTPVLGNKRRCGCGAVGCLETLLSTQGLLQSFAEAAPRSEHTWARLCRAVLSGGVKPWLATSLDATANIIAGALNLLGLRRVVVTGTLNELPPAFDYLSNAISRGALWARFGKISVEAAPRHRIAGLVAVGLDRFILPITEPDREDETHLHVAALQR